MPNAKSDHPKLAPNRQYYKISFLELFSKKPTSHQPSGILSKSKKLLQVILYLSLVPKTNRARNFFLMDFSISLLQPSPYLRKFTENLFFILSLLGFILQRLCSRQVPHVASHPGSLYPEISDLPIRVKDFWEPAEFCILILGTRGILHPYPVHGPRLGTSLPHAPGVRMT